MTSKSNNNKDYYIPEPSPLPIIGALGLFVFLFGVSLAVNDIGIGAAIMVVGLGVILYLFYSWFKVVVCESEGGKYNKQVDVSFRQGMVWFIASEVFFFVTFFCSLYYLRNIAIPSLAGEGHLPLTGMLWEGFKATWPLLQLPDPEAGYVITKEAMGAGGIPLINTVILLTSGATITWAHHGLKHGNRNQLNIGMFLTIILGLTFVVLQAYEYYHAYTVLDLRLNSGVYGSIFYFLTGFHGLHVTLGSIMLIIILIRCLKGHFTPERHFAFEGVAWYWHFVDVVWLGLYIFVYWL